MEQILFGPGPINAVQEFFGPAWAWLFHLLSLLGTTVMVLSFGGLVFWLRGRRLTYEIAVMVAVGGLISAALWQLIGLPRPDAPQIVVRQEVAVSSFPSGHTVSATVLWGLLGISGFIPLVVSVAAVALTMLSRLYLGSHYLGDVLGGVAIGILLLGLARHAWPPLADWLSRRSFRLYLILGGLTLLGALVAGPIVLPGADEEGVRTYGLIVGGIAAALLEYAFVRYAPGGGSPRSRVLRAVIGLAGLAVFLVPASGIIGSLPVPLVAGLVALGSLWAIFLAPAAFTRLGLADRKDVQSTEGPGQSRTVLGSEHVRGR